MVGEGKEMGRKDDGTGLQARGGAGAEGTGLAPPFGPRASPPPYLPAGSVGAPAPSFSSPPAATGSARPSGRQGTRVPGWVPDFAPAPQGFRHHPERVAVAGLGVRVPFGVVA